MRIRAVAETLVVSVRDLAPDQRRRQLAVFLVVLSRARRWKILPRLVAAVASVETDAGRPPVDVAVPAATPEVPEHVAVAIRPALIGGAVVRSGDTLVDTSLATQLSRLSAAMKE